MLGTVSRGNVSQGVPPGMQVPGDTLGMKSSIVKHVWEKTVAPVGLHDAIRV